MLRIEKICEERGVQAMIAKKTGINKPAVSRIVRGLEPPYPKRGWDGDWRELFEGDEGDGGGEVA